jgi:sulfate transport system substrate-binding protein
MVGSGYQFFRGRSFKRLIAGFLLGIGLSISIVACSSVGSSRSQVELTLVSFAVTRSAYESILPLFAAKWKAEHQQDVVFNQSYGGSGAQARSVVDGLDADIVNLALALDVKRIEAAGLLQAGWDQRIPHGAIVTHSVVDLVTREGNPKNIQGWADLAREDVHVVTANPKTSGGARWNFMALWGAVTQREGNDMQALDYTKRVYSNAPVLPRDAREASDAFFQQGQGDVLLNYENEVILARKNGMDLPSVLPTDINVSIDNPIAVVDTNVDKHGTRAVAEAFVQFLFTPEAQREFAKAGFRPVDQQIAQEFAAQYPKVNNLFTVKELGGWGQVQAKFFDDGAVFDQIQARIRG